MTEDASLIELSQRDVTLCEAMAKWIATARKAGYGADWLPCSPDIWKSRLFWRIRSGKEPLEHAPPRAYSCPWYEVIEESRIHSAFEPVWISDRQPDKAVVCQCFYDIVEREGDDLVLGFGPYRFRARAGGTWIQRAPDKESI